MDAKNNQPENAGTTPRNSQSQTSSSTSASASPSNASRSTSSNDYVNPDVAQPKSTIPDLTATNSQPEGNLLDNALESGKAALESGKKWIEESGITDTVNQQTKNVQEWGKRTVARASNLTTTQKVVGGALLAAGLGWLALSGKKNKNKDNSKPNVFGRRGKTGSSYGRKSGYQQDTDNSRNSGVLSSMPSFGSGLSATPESSYDRSSSGSRRSESSTVSDNVASRRPTSGYQADE